MKGTLERQTPPAEQPQGHTDIAVARQQYLTGPQICEAFGISRWTWQRWVRCGVAPQPAPLPGHPRWTVGDINRFEQGGRRSFTSHLRAKQAVAVRIHDRSVRSGRTAEKSAEVVGER